jgi:uroporphyrinogen-III decarboxylase
MRSLRRLEQMTSKERVMATFAHKETDRVPIGYCANGDIHRRLSQALDVRKGEWVGHAIGVDFIDVGAPYRGKCLHAELEGRSVNPEWGIRTRWIEHPSGGYWDYCDFPLRDADVDTVAKWPMPDPNDYDYDTVVEKCRRDANFALHAGNGGLGDIINMTGTMRGMEQVLVDLITDDPAGLLLIDRRLDVMFEVTRRTLEAAKGKIDFLWLGEDLGTQNSPIMSLDLFRKHIRPRHQRFVDLAKHHGIPVMIHTCGSSSWAYEDFIEMGVNGVDTLQPEATNMSPEYLKKTFGGRLIFHGCISTAGPVAYGTPEEVTAYCRKTLDIMMPGGGYCFAPTHALQDNSPTENVVAMYEAANAYGRYGKGCN